jgi:aminopeptidase S
MVGSPNPGRFVYDDATSPAGSTDLTQRLLDALSGLGKPGQALDLGGGSDHYAFGQAGIPIGGVFSGLDPMSEEDASLFGGTALAPMDPCYHLACDTRDIVDSTTPRCSAGDRRRLVGHRLPT